MQLPYCSNLRPHHVMAPYKGTHSYPVLRQPARNSRVRDSFQPLHDGNSPAEASLCKAVLWRNVFRGEGSDRED